MTRKIVLAIISFVCLAAMLTLTLSHVAARPALDHDPLCIKVGSSGNGTLAKFKIVSLIKNTLIVLTTTTIPDDPDNGILRANSRNASKYEYPVSVITRNDASNSGDPPTKIELDVYYRNRSDGKRGLKEVNNPGPGKDPYYSINPQSTTQFTPIDANHTKATFKVKFYKAIFDLTTEPDDEDQPDHTNKRDKIKLYLVATKLVPDVSDSDYTKVPGWHDCFSTVTVVNDDLEANTHLSQLNLFTKKWHVLTALPRRNTVSHRK